MNNLTWMGRKVARDLLERRAVGSVRAVLPHVEQFIAVNRYPLLPKIVLYSAAASSESLLRQAFPYFTFLTPTPTAETDDAIARRLAEEVSQVDEENPASQRGYGLIFMGFPFNPAQALLLDQYLNGVNLAIHCRQPDEPADFASSLQPLLNYYDERGSLLQLHHSTEPTFDEIATAQQEIKIKIKRSV